MKMANVSRTFVTIFTATDNNCDDDVPVPMKVDLSTLATKHKATLW